METQTQEAPKAEVKEAEFVLSQPRDMVKKGMPTDGTWLFAGLPKSGKTTLLASAPGTIILELEKGGADRVAGWVQEIPDMPTFRKALLAALKEPKVKIIAVDTLDVLLDWIEEDVALKYGLETMSERKEGVNGFAVWEELGKRVRNLMATFKNCNKLVVLLAHFKEPKLDAEGKIVISHNINATGKLAGYICGQVDVIGNCFKRPLGQDTQYVLSFQGGGMLGTFGGRVSELESKTLILPKTNQWSAIEAVFNPEVKKTEKGAKK